MSHVPQSPLTVELLEALARAWMELETPVQIGSDLEKVRLLKRVVQEAPGCLTSFSDSLRVLYNEVFLQEVEQVALR